jgi:DNA gyrase/topoisomerase IV subunit A
MEAGQPNHDSTIADGDSILLVSQRGLGFILQVEGIANIKRNGKRALKLHDDDFLADATKVHKKVAFITKRGYSLQYKSSELPSRAQAAVGVLLMSVHSDDAIVGCVSYDTNAMIDLECANAKPRSLDSKEIQEGKRALKGNKLGLRAEIVSITKVE